MLSTDVPRLHRSYLYAPGSRPEVMHKALDAGADAVVLDLEDAVALDAKAEAQSHVAALLDERATTTPLFSDVHVRINRNGDTYAYDDLDAVVRRGLDGVRLPKVEHPEAVADVAAYLDRLERQRSLRPGQVKLYPTVESARGMTVVTAVATASVRVVRFAVGTTDLLADLGIAEETRWSTLHLRSDLVLRSRVAGIGPPIDSVHTRLHDEDGLLAAARHAASLGFYGKSLIHPRQIAAAHRVFTPSAAEFAHAERIVAALREAEKAGRGAVTLDGEFIDAAVVARARSLLNLRSQP